MELQKIDLTSKPSPAPITKEVTEMKKTNSVSGPFLTKARIFGLSLALILGLVGGYFVKSNPSLANKVGLPQTAVTSTGISETGLKEGDVVGVSDVKTFKDEVKGVVDKGGLDGEGSHKLLRPGGKSQTVYLTSSVIDLDEFVGHEVSIWGETFAGQKAGWLMDVGRVRVEKLNAAIPE